MREYLWAIIIGLIQAIITAVVTIALTNNWAILVAIILIDIIIFVILYMYYKKKIESKDEEIRLYRNVGIIGCTEELQGTRFEPRQCMRDVRRYLDFMGVGGNKWVDQDDKRDLFENMLKRVKVSKGKVRYLLIDPRSNGYKQLKVMRHNRVPISSFRWFEKWVREYDCLEVRLYDDLPSFRLQFVDQEYVAVSRYYMEHEMHAKNKYGYKIPHLIVRAEKRNDIQKGEVEYKATFYQSFEQLYENIWAHSVDIKEVDISALLADRDAKKV